MLIHIPVWKIVLEIVLLLTGKRYGLLGLLKITIIIAAMHINISGIHIKIVSSKQNVKYGLEESHVNVGSYSFELN